MAVMKNVLITCHFVLNDITMNYQIGRLYWMLMKYKWERNANTRTAVREMSRCPPTSTMTTLIVSYAQSLFQFSTLLLHFTVKITAHSLLSPRLLVEFSPPLLLWIANHISHSLRRKNQCLYAHLLIVKMKKCGLFTFRSLVWEMSHLLMNCWGSLAKLRKNSRLIFSWLMLSTVSCILLSKVWKTERVSIQTHPVAQ